MRDEFQISNIDQNVINLEQYDDIQLNRNENDQLIDLNLGIKQ